MWVFIHSSGRVLDCRGTNSHSAAGTVSPQSLTWSPLPWWPVSGPPGPLGLSGSPCRGRVSASFLSPLQPPVSTTTLHPPYLFWLSPTTEHSEECEPPWSPECEQSPALPNWGKATEPLFIHDLHRHWLPGTVHSASRGGNVTMTTDPGAAGRQNTYLKKKFPYPYGKWTSLVVSISNIQTRWAERGLFLKG